MGYVYLNIDDCWAVDRDENGRLVEDPAAFPEKDGIKDLAKYVHAKGPFTIFVILFINGISANVGSLERLQPSSWTDK